METLILIMSICSFIFGLFFLVAGLTGSMFYKFTFKIISLFATITPIIYWLKILNII